MAAPQDSTELSAEPFRKQFASLGRIYWIANWMELVERFAYYGARVVLPVFIVAAFQEGGPELTQIQKGHIYGVWAVVQSFIPILSGGFADRYGYKINIALSTVLKIIGYLIMGYTVLLSEMLCGMPLSEARPLGADDAYGIFFTGAMFLAFGTAIFKPGVQGLIAAQMPKNAASLGWGLFYQMVNVGGFLGPLMAGYLRVLEWEYVFLACSAGIALNFIPLMFFKEPARPEAITTEGPGVLLYRAVKGLLEPRLFFFTISFAGFWLMFYQLFDILPNFIDDWVDSRMVAQFLSNIFGSGLVPTVNGGNLTQEWMINVNAGLISLLAFVVGYLTGKMRSLTAIIVGIAISAVGIYALGMSMSGWWIIGAICLFSLGEMMASPTKMRYLAGIAPAGREGLYMGYVNFTVGIGWSIGSIIAGNLYQENGDKTVLAKRYLIEEHNVPAADVNALTKFDVLPFFERTVGVDAWETRQLLWEAYEPWSMWLIFTVIGVASMIAIMVYNRVVIAADANPAHSWNASTGSGNTGVRAFLIPICVLLFAATIYQPSLALALNTAFFLLMLVISFVGNGDDAQPG
jgi:dipeptide/tripeptide permease